MTDAASISGTDPEQLRATDADDRARVAGLAARLRELEALVEELVNGLPQAAAAEPDRSADAPHGGPVHASLGDFVTAYLTPMFTRPTLGGRWTWCPQWWEHAEAVNRLAALWHSWETLHHQRGTALGSWYRDHLDHQLPILMGPDGPFRDCTTGHYSVEPKELPNLPPQENAVWTSAESGVAKAT